MKQKIVIIGYSGSGKSTLARQLGKQQECEVLHLDCIHWMPGWKERDKSEVKQIVTDFLDSHDSWVIDGNYSYACLDRRINEATRIVSLNFPVHICLYRVLKRYFSNRGKSRKSMTDGCEEKIDWEFFWWVVHKGRNKAKKEWYKNICKENSGKTVILKNPRMVRKFLNT